MRIAQNAIQFPDAPLCMSPQAQEAVNGIQPCQAEVGDLLLLCITGIVQTLDNTRISAALNEAGGEQFDQLVVTQLRFLQECRDDGEGSDRIGLVPVSGLMSAVRCNDDGFLFG